MIKNYRHKAMKSFYGYIGIFVMIMLATCSSCCLSQIPTQYYFATDSCEFYLPDYSQAVEVRDNCCVDSMGFYQTPHSGTILVPGHDITVTLIGQDCYGNTATMTFDVIVIDNVPPTFFYDSTEFLPVGQYQNDDRIFKLYITQDTTQVDDYGNAAIRQYYRDSKGHQAITTNIYDDGVSVSHLDSPDDYRAQLFTAPASYNLTRVRLKLYRTGYDPYQTMIVEIREVDEGDDPIGPVLSRGMKSTKELYSDPEGAWYTIAMRPTTIYHGQEYAIIVRLDRADENSKIEWRITGMGYNGGYAIWTNNGAEETGYWEKNYTVDRLFEIWGNKI